MFNYRLSPLLAFAILLLFSLDSIALDDSNIELSIPSVNGKVLWSDVASQLGDQLQLDHESLQQMLPSGTLDLGAPSVMLTLLTINMAAGDAISFSIGKDELGGQALKLKCRRGFFVGKVGPSAKSIAKSSLVVDLDSNWANRTASKPLVVFLHGMNSGPKVFDAMRAEVRKLGLASASVGYDYQRSISESASQAMISLKRQFSASDPAPELCLIGHSMGGLVARQMTESAAKDPLALDPSFIQQLITIGTPHQGSNWASLPPLSAMFTSDGMDTDDMLSVILHRPSSQGVRDMIPGSPFLQSLNSRDRRDDVRYTAIIGTVSPVNESQVIALRQALQSMDQQGTLLRLIRPRIKPLLESFDELSAGKGDGIVSVESARFTGVEDQVKVAVSHFEMIKQNYDAPEHLVLDVILDRLK